MARFQDVIQYNTSVFEFERNFDVTEPAIWFQHNWTNTFWYSAFYVVVIFSLKWYMKDRPRFDLRIPLGIWSSILAVFSICGAVRTVPEVIYMLNNYGLYHSICHSGYGHAPPTAFWVYLFIMSKVYELGDTVFIILRKQPLILLHWYHHITVLIYTWHCYTELSGPGRWFLNMNACVHSLMYSYYALKAFRFNIPRKVSMVITTMQLLQMVMGITVEILVMHYKDNGYFCQQSYENTRYGLIMYASYFVLFGHFFYHAYLKPKPKPSVKPKTQ